jgi:hypothetical protein
MECEPVLTIILIFLFTILAVLTTVTVLNDTYLFVDPNTNAVVKCSDYNKNQIDGLKLSTKTKILNECGGEDNES